MMQESKQSSKILTVLSVLYVLSAAILLIVVCGVCYPQLGDTVRQVIGGWQDGAMQEAFGTLADGLGAGLPVKETVAASIEVLIRDLA